MIPKCCFFPDLTTLVQLCPLLSVSFPFPRCPGKVLLCQSEACLELVTRVCKTSPAVLTALTFPFIFSLTHIFTHLWVHL